MRALLEKLKHTDDWKIWGPRIEHRDGGDMFRHHYLHGMDFLEALAATIEWIETLP